MTLVFQVQFVTHNADISAHLLCVSKLMNDSATKASASGTPLNYLPTVNTSVLLSQLFIRVRSNMTIPPKPFVIYKGVIIN